MNACLPVCGFMLGMNREDCVGLDVGKEKTLVGRLQRQSRFKWHKFRTLQTGWPDFFVQLPNSVAIPIECKTKQILSKEQKIFLYNWWKNGGLSYSLRQTRDELVLCRGIDLLKPHVDPCWRGSTVFELDNYLDQATQVSPRHRP